MECVSSIKKTPAIGALHIGAKNQRRVSQISSASVAFPNSSGKSQALLKTCGTPKSINARRSRQSLIVAVANSEPRGCKSIGVRTPLEPSSPEGMFLSAILQSHRSLFSFAVSEQLDQLASNRDEAAAQEIQTPTSMQSVLHKRIAEIKEKERQTAVEDVIYMSIVHHFSEFGIPMIPKLSECITDNRLEIWPSKCRELESIHSLEVQELRREHVATVLRTRGKSFLVDSSSTTTKIDRLDLGRIYAASVLYGYFLKSACLRRHMDISLVGTKEDLQPQCNNAFSSVADSYQNRFQSLAAVGQSTNTQLLELCHEPQLMCDTKPENLKSYVMGFDAETLQRCAKIKSQEAVNVIERHTWALFGDDNDNEIVIAFPSLERLVTEAVAFGTFLWDVERSVDSTYTLHKN